MKDHFYCMETGVGIKIGVKDFVTLRGVER
jgi:hypothetical protein